MKTPIEILEQALRELVPTIDSPFTPESAHIINAIDYLECQAAFDEAVEAQNV
jgi:hypothetical protein